MGPKKTYEGGNHIYKRDAWYWAYVDGRRVTLKTKDHDTAIAEYERLTGGEDIHKKPAFDSVVEEYRESGTFNALARPTRDRHSFSFDKFLIPYFRFRRVGKIRPKDLKKYIEERQKAGAAPNTILKETTAFGAVLSWCVEQGYLEYNVAREVKKPSKRDLVRPNHTPDEDEINKVLAELHRSVITFFLTLCNTGARVNELRMTNVKDFDYDLGTLRVIRKGGKEDVLVLNDLVKNRITDDLLHRAEKRDVRPDEPVFLNRYKTRLLSIRRAIKSACERAKVQHLTHHSLRHGYATILYEQGVSIPDVANILGNSIEVCTEIYVKWKSRKRKELARNHQIGTNFVQSAQSAQCENL